MKLNIKLKQTHDFLSQMILLWTQFLAPKTDQIEDFHKRQCPHIIVPCLPWGAQVLAHFQALLGITIMGITKRKERCININANEIIYMPLTESRG